MGVWLSGVCVHSACGDGDSAMVGAPRPSELTLMVVAMPQEMYVHGILGPTVGFSAVAQPAKRVVSHKDDQLVLPAFG